MIYISCLVWCFSWLACGRPEQIFMSTLLNTAWAPFFSSLPFVRYKSDRFYNGVLLIKTSPGINDPFYLSTDTCSTGAGGSFNSQYFHTPFPCSILQRFGQDINALESLFIKMTLKLWVLLESQRFHYQELIKVQDVISKVLSIEKRTQLCEQLEKPSRENDNDQKTVKSSDFLALFATFYNCCPYHNCKIS